LDLDGENRAEKIERCNSIGCRNISTFFWFGMPDALRDGVERNQKAPEEKTMPIIKKSIFSTSAVATTPSQVNANSSVVAHKIASERIATAKGLTTKGLTTKGLTTKGLTTKGLTTKGLTTKGLTTKGLTTKGLTTKGLTTKGLTTKGLTTKGIAS
jgi:hypothetical protein